MATESAPTSPAAPDQVRLLQRSTRSLSSFAPMGAASPYRDKASGACRSARALRTLKDRAADDVVTVTRIDYGALDLRLRPCRRRPLLDPKTIAAA